MAGGMNVCSVSIISASASRMFLVSPRRSIYRHSTQIKGQYFDRVVPPYQHSLRTLSQRAASFPKVQLHIHLDGSVRHKTLWNLARKRGLIPKEKTYKEYLQIFLNPKRGDLKKFLSNFDEILPVISGDQDIISQVAYELCEEQANEGVLYFEARYCPHFLASPLHKPRPHKGNFVTPRDVVIAVNDGILRGCRDFGVKGRTILCMMRRKPEFCKDIIQLCDEFRDDTVVGVDLAGEEAALSTKEHEDAFRIARHLGIHRTVHAGELGPAENVRFAIEELGAQRIGHGYQIANDPKVYEMVREQSIHLELCPVSSLYTGAWNGKLADHCAKRFIKDGLNVSLNTDDPTILFNTMETEFQVARDYFSMNDTELADMTIDAARASFLPADDKDELVRELTSHLELLDLQQS